MNKTWKIYFYFMIAVMVVEYFMRIKYSYRMGLHFSVGGQLELLLSIISFIGLYGFVYKKKIFFRGFWAVFFVAIVVYEGWDSYQNYLFNQKLDQMLPTDPDVFKKITDIFIEYILPLPFFVGLFLYGFKSAAIWKKPADESP